METVTRIAWFALALVHLPPAAAWLAPSLVHRLYGVSSAGVTRVLLVHRGALFAAVLLSALAAAFDPGSRRLASVVASISVLGYLLVYLRAGTPPGPLRSVAWVDVAALVPLALVTLQAWRPGA